MNLTQLRAWIALADAGSLTAAARRVGFTQPALSRQLKSLEKELGVTLVERRHSGVELTPEGHRLLEFARRTVGEYEAMFRSLSGKATGLSGRIRIIASTTPGEYLVPDLAASFGEAHPSVVSEVFVADSAAVVSEVLERRWDLGFVGRRYPRTGLEYLEVAADEIVLAVPVGHRFAKRKTIRLSELEGQALIEREDGSGTRLSVQDILKQAGLSMPPTRVSLVLGSTSAIVSAVGNRLGIGFVTARALENEDARRVAGVRLREVTLVRQLYMVHRTSPPPPRLVRAFIDHVRRSLPPAAA